MSGSNTNEQSGLESRLAALLEQMQQRQRASQSALIPFGDQPSTSLPGSANGLRLTSEKQTAASAAANTQRDDFGRSRNHSGMSLTPPGIGTGKNTCQTFASNSSSAQRTFTPSKQLASDARDLGSGLTTSVVDSESRPEQFTQPCEEDANVKLIASIPSGVSNSFLTSVLSGLDHSSTNAIEVLKNMINSSPNATSKSVGFGHRASSGGSVEDMGQIQTLRHKSARLDGSLPSVGGTKAGSVSVPLRGTTAEYCSERSEW